MITKVNIVLHTRFTDEEQAEEVLESLLDSLCESSEDMIVSYEVAEIEEEDVELSGDDSGRATFPVDDDGELPF